MEKNIGKIDRAVRVVISLTLFLLGMYLHIALITAIGLLVFLSAVIQFCFLYKLLKINTLCKKNECEK